MVEVEIRDEVVICDLEAMVDAHNYRAWMFRRLSPHIGNRVLEVGAGIGNFTQLLLDKEFLVPSDKALGCVQRLRERFRDTPQVSPVLLDLGAPEGEWISHRFDTAIAVNVLEHVEDDAAALHFLRSVVVQKGRVVILVPAYSWLLGTVDHSIGHHRRYTRKTLLPRMRDAGLLIEHSFYMNVIGIAGWYWNNRIRKIPMEDPRQIRRFDRYIAPWAERLERIIHPPVGLSLIAVGRRR